MGHIAALIDATVATVTAHADGLTGLDPEPLRLWDAPVHTPALRW